MKALPGLLCLTLLLCGCFHPQQAVQETPEPDAGAASLWWPAQRNVWTPLGWPDHLFRFNLIYNGTLVADPSPAGRELTRPWAGQGCELTFYPGLDPDGLRIPGSGGPYQLCALPDRGVGNQGWTDSPAPVLWSEWPLPEGVVLRQEVFAHLAGGSEVQSGVEPLYAWVRLSVARVDPLRAPDSSGFLICLSSPDIQRNMEQERNLTVLPERSAYPRALTARPEEDGAGLSLEEPDGRVRLLARTLPGAEVGLVRTPDASASGRYWLRVALQARPGAALDLLLPLVPSDKGEIGPEADLGRESALTQCEAFWRAQRPDSAAEVVTPELWLNRALERSLQFARIITEKDPGTGETSFLSGSWQYDRLWPTPTSMTSHMLLDLWGYSDAVERHLEIFRTHQGEIVPPGPSYSADPGYFCSPKSLTSIDWLSDNGAVLYTVCRHARLTGDSAFTARWLDPVLKSCEFIRRARAVRGHDGVPGVLPPAVAEDRGVSTQSVWNVGWNYKGLTEAVSLLKSLGHPLAAQYEAEAEDYRATFVKALRERTAQMPQWTDSLGVTHPVVAHSLSAGGDICHAFYLDTGPLFLVWAGLLPAQDELMEQSRLFFRDGPYRSLYDRRGNCWQRPVLIHELSSCEPCYSWNVFHSWQLGERGRYLECMYSLLAGALSPQTFISCETRDGIYGNVFAAPLLADLVRLAVIDDELEPGRLHLLRLVPKAWLRPDFRTRFERMPTLFGPVSLSFSLSADRQTIKVDFIPRWRSAPQSVLLTVPPLAGLEKVILNGRTLSARPGQTLTVGI